MSNHSKFNNKKTIKRFLCFIVSVVTAFILRVCKILDHELYVCMLILGVLVLPDGALLIDLVF